MNTKEIKAMVKDFYNNFAELQDCVISPNCEMVCLVKDNNEKITIIYNYAFGYAMVMTDLYVWYKIKLSPKTQRDGLQQCQIYSSELPNHILNW